MVSIDSTQIQTLVGPLRFEESRFHSKTQRNEMKLSFSKWHCCVCFPLLRSKGKSFFILCKAWLLSYIAQSKGQLGA